MSFVRYFSKTLTVTNYRYANVGGAESLVVTRQAGQRACEL